MAVSTPGHAQYGRYLSPAQVMARFGPTQAQVSAVRSWLSGAGLTVTKVTDEVGGYVVVQGSVQAAGWSRTCARSASTAKAPPRSRP
jgi:subtilase family serine protease